jgi:glucoside 3-dehydrogenase (cytochrome c) hitch-hiker subunit
MDRREFIAALGRCSATVPALGLLSVPAQVALGREVHTRVGDVPGPRALDEHQFRLVSRLAELILPETDTPGATAVKVPEFIDLLLAESLMEKDKAHLLAGLEQIDAQSRATRGQDFLNLKEQDQTALMHTLDVQQGTRSDGDAGGDGTAQQTFARLKGLVIFGYFTSEVVMKGLLKLPVVPGRYDGNVPV